MHIGAHGDLRYRQWIILNLTACLTVITSLSYHLLCTYQVMYSVLTTILVLVPSSQQSHLDRRKLRLREAWQIIGSHTAS